MRNIVFALFVNLLACNAFVTAAPTAATYYVLYDDGGEHPVEECAVTKTLPANLTRLLKIKKDYLGTRQTAFAESNAAAIDAFEHYFSSKASCEQYLKSMNSW